MTAKEFFNDLPSTSTSTLKTNEPPPTKETNEKNNVSESSHVPPKISLENKTELEIKVIESIHMKFDEKKDLFRSIFCDSESEDEVEKEIEDVDKIIKEKTKFVESFLTVKPASEINVLRNTSPARGLFKNLLVEPPVFIPVKKSSDVHNTSDEYYGPKLPNQPIQKTSSEPALEILSDLDKKILDKIKKKKHKVSEKWVDKEELLKKKHKLGKHKKDKKQKKEKKHKSKH